MENVNAYLGMKNIIMNSSAQPRLYVYTNARLVITYQTNVPLAVLINSDL